MLIFTFQRASRQTLAGGDMVDGSGFEGEQEGAGWIQTDKMGYPITTCHFRQDVATWQ